MTAPYPVSKAASLPDFQNGNDIFSRAFIQEITDFAAISESEAQKKKEDQSRRDAS